MLPNWLDFCGTYTTIAQWGFLVVVICGGWSFLAGVVWPRVLRPRTNYSKFKGEWAVVTGASMGLGKEYARGLAARGLHVVLVARSKDLLETIAKEIRVDFKVEAEVVAVDLINTEPAMQTIEQATKDLTPYCDWTVDFEQNTRDLNGTATYRLIRMFLPKMIQRNKGFILNVSSLASQVNLYLIPYGSEKAKINAMTKFLDCELAQTNITIQAHKFSAVWSDGLAKFFGVPKPTLSAPRASVCVEASLDLFGSGPAVITPYWTHHLQISLMDALPLWLQKFATIQSFSQLRAARLAVEHRLQGKKDQ